MTPVPVAVVGVGQTSYRTSHPEMSAPELVFQAVSRALADADAELDDIDAVVFASAPEVFEGVNEPDRWCAEAAGALGKPMLRIHTGGATGGSGALAGSQLVAAGQFETVLVVGLQRVAESIDAQQIFTTIFDPVYESDIQLNVITTVAMIASRQLDQGHLTEQHMAWVAEKNFRAALSNPFAHLHRRITMEEVNSSRMLAWPIRLLHACPRSDGACAVVLTSADRVRGRPAAWVQGMGTAADVYRLGDRVDDLDWDLAEPRALAWAAQKAYTQAGIMQPDREIDVVEMYAPFANIEIVSYPALGLAPRGQGWRLVEAGDTAPEGRLPVCPSGGTQTANPIGATGLVRFAEAALQVTGRAGDHQIDGARTAVATATGGITQFFTVAVLSQELDR